MRKCEEIMVGKIMAGHSGGCGGNTEVIQRAEYAMVTLHGNPIGKVYGPVGAPTHVEVSLAGWDTVTTRSRINALLRGIGKGNGEALGCVFKHKGGAYARWNNSDPQDVMINSLSEWVRFTRPIKKSDNRPMRMGTPEANYALSYIG